MYNNILLYYTFVQIFPIPKTIKYNIIIGNIFYFKIDILNLLEYSRIKNTRTRVYILYYIICVFVLCILL